MRNFILSRGFLTIMLFLPFCDQGLAGQTNVLTGKVLMPDSRPKSRITRGQAYRNRGVNVISDERRRINEANRPQNNVIISLKPLTFNPHLAPTQEAYIRQREKTFHPNVLPVTVGTTVYFINDDAFYHNVFSITPRARFNIGRRPAGTRHGRRIDKVGEVKIFCDIHPQMRATIIGLDTPYFTRVDDQGNYHLAGLPDGTYEAAIFHPNQAKTTERITISGGRTMTRNFNLTASSPSPTSFFMGPERTDGVMCVEEQPIKSQ